MFSRKLNWLSAAALVALGIALQPSSSEVSASTDSELPLTAISTIRSMDRSELAVLTEVRFRGIVTLHNNEWNTLFVYQDGNSIKVGVENDDLIAVGTQVEVRGQAVLGDVGPVVVASDLKILDDTLPTSDLKAAALKIGEDRSFSASLVDQLVEFEGVAYSAVADDKRHYVVLAGKSFGAYAIIPNAESLPPLKEFRTARVRLLGIPAISVQPGAEGQIDLLVPDARFVEILPTPQTAAGPKFRNIAAIGHVEIQNDVEVPARIRAVVRAVSDNNRIFVSDETGSLLVEIHKDSPDHRLTPGDVVEVEGPVVRNHEPQFMTEAMVRYVGNGFSFHPESMTAVEALDHPAELIEVDGTLVALSNEEHWFLIKSGDHSFRVRSTDAITDQLREWGIGSQLRFVGCPWESDKAGADFELYAASASVIFGLPAFEPATSTRRATTTRAPVQPAAPVFENGPPFWGPPHPSFFLRPPGIIALPALIVLGGVIVWLICRRVKAQEKFQESIHEQLNNLSHIARLNTLSEMVGALAHELSQPLASVSNYAAAAELVRKNEPADSEKLGSLLTQISKETFRASEIIRRLRNLVRRKTPGSLPVEISEIVRESVELFKTQHVTANGFVTLEIPENLPAVQADTIQIQQVILNLLLNARDATMAQSERAPAAVIRVASEDGMVSVTVSDNGIGIANPNPDAIFEPYFTTREKGTGLGLAISRTIIESHGGRISARNASPHGTEITFTLPISS